MSQKNKFLLILILLVLLIGMSISGYLLYHHFSLIYGKSNATDLCSVIFSKSCNNALFSSISSFLNIPMGGWGLIYMTIIGLFVASSHWLNESLKIPLLETAFWISVPGIIGSGYFTVMMILIPPLFCPFCVAFHVLNFILFFLIKIETSLSFKRLFSDLINAVRFLITGKNLTYTFRPIFWLPFLVPFFVGLTIFQWARMEEMKYKINKLASYSPLEELMKFDSSQVFNVALLPDDQMLGSMDAPVDLIVFSDFQCQMCQYFATNFNDLLEINKGKLKIYFKNFPISSTCNPLVQEIGHPLACEAAFAAEAAKRQGHFWAYHDSLFSYDLGKYDKQIFFQIAENMNLNMDKFKIDFESDSCRLSVKENIDQAISLKIDGTPTVFLNGHLVRDLRPENLNFLIRYLSK